MVMTPGTYLRIRREAARLSLEDLALRIGTDPRLSTRDRAEWLRTVEAGIAPIHSVSLDALVRALPIDPVVLVVLDAIAQGAEIQAPAICRVCGCSEHNPCIVADSYCAWAAPDLCDACAPGAGSPAEAIAA